MELFGSNSTPAAQQDNTQYLETMGLSAPAEANYVVLARKWRPAQFEDIVGQTHVVRTMMNAITSQRIHQAYLMTGSRGIGKTSIARIFAKAVRCQSLSQGPNQELRSCGECASCREITGSTSVDVIEIDGASNNGVDAVREIRENAKFLPATGSRKIYIIDEVHMLTTAAFNALLKTLEEPPPHVIFIFATTEPHKIPATILSRCQRFDLKRVTVSQIQGRVLQILKAEGVEAEPGAVAVIARAAEGSMRDSLSLLDQVIAYCGGFSGKMITVEGARESVGLIGGATVLGILDGVLGRKPLDALALVESSYQQGHDLRVLTRSLIEFMHAAVLAKIGAPNPPSLELSEDEWAEVIRLAGLRELGELELIFQALHYGVDWIARSPQPKLVLDVILIKCATGQSLVQVHAGRVNASTAIQAAPVLNKGVSPAPRPATLAPPASVAPTNGPSFARSIAASLIEGKSKPVPSSAPTPVLAEPQPVVAAPRIATPVTTFEAFVDVVKKARPLLASIIENGGASQLPSAQDPTLVLCFRLSDAYYRDQIQSKNFADQLQQIAQDCFLTLTKGAAVKVRVELKEMGETLANKREREHQEKQNAAILAAQSHPMITEARSLFGGELGPIELVQSQPSTPPPTTGAPA